MRLATRLEGEHVIIEIIDSGAGMEPDVQARAFRSVSRPKRSAMAPGLGLDISRRIVVDRRRGDISIASQPGKTSHHSPPSALPPPLLKL